MAGMLGGTQVALCAPDIRYIVSTSPRVTTGQGTFGVPVSYSHCEEK